LLLEDLKSSAPVRIINGTSQTYIPGYGGGPGPDFDYENLKGEKYYQPQVFYKNSKLAIAWFTYELQRRLGGSGMTANAVCPGFVPAFIAERSKSPIQLFLPPDHAAYTFCPLLGASVRVIYTCCHRPALCHCRRKIYCGLQRDSFQQRILRSG
jgi:NAD(P)-dependent dehydrogenase (short-subunit alcohol dehydrogenase family)